jgi:HKD family nuclease
MEFIHQPHGPTRIGQYLIDHFADLQWSEFRAAIAFAKRSGTQHLRPPLEEFDRRARVRVSVGVDLLGTSREGLGDLLHCTPNGQIWIYHNNAPYTFHPKVYLFKSNDRADLLVGSGNLTEGGLFTNYESSLAVSLRLANADDAALLQSVEQVLDPWARATPGRCHLLTDAFLDQLVAAGLVRSEAQLAAIAQQAPIAAPDLEHAPAGGAPAGQAAALIEPLFIASGVPAAPAVLRAAVVALAEGAQVQAQAGAPVGAGVEFDLPVSFVMTLRQTDVGVGQVNPGKARRSAEVFIPLAALDAYPAFWGFPHLFRADAKWNARNKARRNGLGKLDRWSVPMRIGMVHNVNMFFNPNKKDIRLRAEAIRSSGDVGDIIWIQRAAPNSGFAYDVQVAPNGSPLFKRLEPLCNQAVRKPSLKRFGYF